MPPHTARTAADTSALRDRSGGQLRRSPPPASTKSLVACSVMPHSGALSGGASRCSAGKNTVSSASARATRTPMLAAAVGESLVAPLLTGAPALPLALLPPAPPTDTLGRSGAAHGRSRAAGRSTAHGARDLYS